MSEPFGNAFIKPLPRREFLKLGGAALGTSGMALPVVAAKPQKTPETLVKILYDSLDEKQRKVICFDWNHLDKKRGLLRTRLENNWKITNPTIDSKFYTADQKALLRASGHTAGGRGSGAAASPGPGIAGECPSDKGIRFGARNAASQRTRRGDPSRRGSPTTVLSGQDSELPL
jgi:hypothetical protein